MSVEYLMAALDDVIGRYLRLREPLKDGKFGHGAYINIDYWLNIAVVIKGDDLFLEDAE